MCRRTSAHLHRWARRTAAGRPHSNPTIRCCTSHGGRGAHTTWQTPQPHDRLERGGAINPEDATSADVCRLAHEFGIKGPVYVKSYSAPGAHIMMDIVEGEEGPWRVTRYPRDMDGCIGRLADQLRARLGASVLGKGAVPPRRAWPIVGRLALTRRP
jgi:hypothetical protein